MNVDDAIRSAESILPGVAAPEGERDPRWQAVIAVGEFIESNPDRIWEFAEWWGQHHDEDMRTAIATCILEHLLDYDFERFFPRAERLARSNPWFAETVGMCWLFGEAKRPTNAARVKRLLAEAERL